MLMERHKVLYTVIMKVKKEKQNSSKKYSLDTRTVKIIQRILQVRYPANPQNVEVAVNSKSATVSAE
ncbi:ORF083 [Staphylococcus phage 42E]|uniref:ORF083 n=1 Tax=Staphylococcus phage 42E TaxID=2908113 RepID=Q4ZD09_9CAUD|nr:ORF083 [Staphylococcus phage 42E]AAX91176.1 ORF083 [Staphylococcus phage 42E]